MSPLLLSAADQTRVANALQALLSPLDHDTIDGWRCGVNESLKRLIRADAAVFEVPREFSPRPVFSEDYPGAPPDDYLALFWPLAEKYDTAARICRLGVCTREEMWWPGWEEYQGSAYRNEFLLPHRMYDAIILASRGRSGGTFGTAQVVLHRNSRVAPAFGERERAMLRTLLPAFQSGLDTWLRLRSSGSVLAQALDVTGAALAVVGLGGSVLHQTPALVALLEREPERKRLAVAVVHAAHAATRALAVSPTPSGDSAEPSAEVVTASSRYRVRASRVGEGTLGPDPVAVVLVDLAVTPSDEEVKSRFGLTRQEVRVAWLLAERLTNAEIAEILFVSLSTARHHVEHVMTKLNVTSRREVGEALRASGPSGWPRIG